MFFKKKGKKPVLMHNKKIKKENFSLKRMGKRPGHCIIEDIWMVNRDKKRMFKLKPQWLHFILTKVLKIKFNHADQQKKAELVYHHPWKK